MYEKAQKVYTRLIDAAKAYLIFKDKEDELPFETFVNSFYWPHLVLPDYLECRLGIREEDLPMIRFLKNRIIEWIKKNEAMIVEWVKDGILFSDEDGVIWLAIDGDAGRATTAADRVC